MKGWDPINDCTIITPYYNTKPEYFLSYLKSMQKFPSLRIIIGNDGSGKKETATLHSMVSRANKDRNRDIEIIDWDENVGMCGTLYELIDDVKTKYVIKCDSDDGIHHFPEFSTKKNSADFDAAITRNCKITVESFLADRGNGPGGSVYKTEVFKKIYSDWEFMDRNEKWIHEDVWMHLNLLFGNYKVEHEVAEDNTKIYEYKYRRPGSMTANKQLDNRSPKCETFLLWAREHHMRPQLYHKLQKEINEIRNSK